MKRATRRATRGYSHCGLKQLVEVVHALNQLERDADEEQLLELSYGKAL